MAHSLRQPKKVLIIGAGVGGLTAAHELSERGYEVTVIEQDHTPGGKAATQYPMKRIGGELMRVPAEHGFRLFPTFYKHVIDTMQRIPFDRSKKRPLGKMVPLDPDATGRTYDTVADNLQPTPAAATARHGYPPRHSPRAYGTDVDGMIRMLGDSIADEHYYSSSETDLQRFQLKALQYFTSCTERRDSVKKHGYGSLSWWEYVGADTFTPRFQNEIDTFIRTMVSMDARTGNARTIGTVGMQLLLDLTGDGSKTDRVFNGPTSDQWLLPWVAFLMRGGEGRLAVKFEFRCRAVDFQYKRSKRRIEAVRTVNAEGVASSRRFGIDFDHVVAALPVEGMQRLLCRSDEDLARDDKGLKWIRGLDIGRYTAWMSGAQFYLEQDVPIVRGHVYYPDAQWRLTSISQAQFWGPEFMRLYAQNKFRGILSVDICDWEHTEGSHTAGAYQRTARECESADDVAAEIWEQLRWGTTCNGRSLLPERYLAYHLDDYIRFPERDPPSERERIEQENGREGVPPQGLRARVGTRRLAYNGSPYFIHPPGSHLERPAAGTTLANLFLASDYVSTTTDLSSMEGANEAARRAVNAILERDMLDGGQGCLLFDFKEPAQLDFVKQLDRDLFVRGEPHLFEVLGLLRNIERTQSSSAASGVLALALSSLRSTQALSGVATGLTRAI